MFYTKRDEISISVKLNSPFPLKIKLLIIFSFSDCKLNKKTISKIAIDFQKYVGFYNTLNLNTSYSIPESHTTLLDFNY